MLYKIVALAILSSSFALPTPESAHEVLSSEDIGMLTEEILSEEVAEIEPPPVPWYPQGAYGKPVLCPSQGDLFKQITVLANVFQLEGHNIGRGVAVSKKLFRFNNDFSATIGGGTWIKKLYANNIEFNGSPNLRGGIAVGAFPFLREWFYLKQTAWYAVNSTLKAPDGDVKVIVVNQGRHPRVYSTADFEEGRGAAAYRQGKTIVIFQGTGTVRITPTYHGRQFWPAVLAPWAKVDIQDNAHAIDGWIAAPVVITTGPQKGELEYHGNPQYTPIKCVFPAPSPPPPLSASPPLPPLSAPSMPPLSPPGQPIF